MRILAWRNVACIAPVAKTRLPWAVISCSSVYHIFSNATFALTVFLKRVLFCLIRLGMTRTRSQFAPAMSMQETVDAIDMHFMLHLRAHSPAESARPWQSLPVRLARRRAAKRPVPAPGSDIHDGVRLWLTAR